MAIHSIISFTDSGNGVNWQVTYDDVAKIIQAQSDVPTTDYDVTEADMGVPAGSNLYSACESFTNVKIKSHLHFPFAIQEREENSVACGWSGPVGSITKLGSSYGISSARLELFEVGPIVPPGSKYNLSVYGHTITYVAQPSDTLGSVVTALINLVNSTTAAQWNEEGGAPPESASWFPPLAVSLSSRYDRFIIYTRYSGAFTAWTASDTPTPINFSLSVESTDETATGLHDGSATILTSGTPGLVYSYSLDGVNFQSDNTFAGLYPGNYVVTVRGSVGGQMLTKSAIFVIAAAVEPPAPVIDFPWRDKICYFFRLIRDGITYAIKEPIKWDSINLVGKRDREWHGWNYQYSDGVIDLEFDCEAGKEVIEAEYAENGSDGNILFEYGYTYKGTEYVLFPGKLNLNTRKRLPGKIACSVERADFNNLLQSRIDTKVSMAAVATMDGENINPPLVNEFTLHAKEIVRNYKMENLVPQDLPQEVIAGKQFIYVIPDTSAPQVNEIEENFTYPLGVAYSHPTSIDLYNWVLKYRGVYSFLINYTFKFRFTAINTTIRAVVKHHLFINGVSYQLAPEVILTPGVTHTISVNHNFQNQLLDATTKVYFFTSIEMTQDFAPLSMWITEFTINTSAVSLEAALPSICKGWFLFDAINHAIQVVTNKQASLRSQFLSRKNSQQAADGPGALSIVTNGKQIRQYEVSQWPLITSPKTLLNTSKSIWCLGLGFEQYAGKEVVRMERVNYFYRNKEILVIEECWDYKEETAKDLLYNEIEIGYDKYQDEGFNTLDEANTKHEQLTPIKTNKLKLVQKSPAITSGYAIEDSRRQQFADTATNSYSNDDETFLIAMRRIDADTYEPEKDEAFEKVENLISPGTAYNLRHSPLRMLLNWAIWLKNIFFYKPDTDKISTTYVAQNGEMVSQFKATEPNPVGDLNRSEWQEKQNIDLSDYPVEERLWRPEWITFKAQLTPDKIQLINEAMRGQRDEGKNYGYIVVKDDNGEYQAGWVYELAYNFATEQADFKMLMKWDSPVEPSADCCDYLVVNGCYILINGNKIVV